MVTLPEGLKVVRPTAADLPRINDLVEAIVQSITPDHTFSLEQPTRVWTESQFDPQYDAWLVENNAGDLVAYAQINGWAQATRFMQWAGVHPAYQGQGIEDVMVEWMEKRAAEQLTQAPPEYAVTLYNRINHKATYWAELLQQKGYSHDRTWWNMIIDLDQAIPAPQFPDHITLRTVDPERDLPALHAAETMSFSDHYGSLTMPFAEWVRKMQGNNYDPNLWFMAMDGEAIAGFVICQPKRASVDNLGWIRVLGVVPTYRRMGLATALLRHMFHVFRGLGKTHAGLSVDAANTTGATRVYEQAGMQVYHQLDTYAKQLRDGAEYLG